ncbi:kinesin-like protein KIN-10C isoform X2 [Salvia hispanica]|uniref:kinesin-like protein KIN-10C isoform X2 n=1 Tax=Salvia hispanica TaxID=49212 RepID=UPI0020094D47|nr:kinesin-like protein KIN-10C isoform X2 [Salvia hispanica]
MALEAAATSNALKSNRCSNPGNVRIIGKIRGLTHRESESLNQDSKPWITVKNPEENGSSQKCKVYFETQSTKVGYELDYCYEQLEEIDRIYTREIQPLVRELFEGRNASVIALGAKGSGKTFTIQGSQEKPGLAVMAMSDILAKAKETGKSVSMSLYELTQENVKDLLNPDHPAIKVLDDAHGKVNIIGLSKVPVNSITEFQNMYISQVCSQNTQKVVTDQSHQKGLMVHISSDDCKMKVKLANKINFVDLAGYEDLRKQGTTPVDSNRKNKSLYALLNVISAISANETRVPYRDSKLTRILQDSLCGGNRVLLLTCLNPFFCQDSLSSINLISHRQSTKQVLTDSTNRSQTPAKVKTLSSFQSGKTISASVSAKKPFGHSQLHCDSTNRSQTPAKVKTLSSFQSEKTISASVSAKKPFGHSQLHCAAKDSRNLKGRKLFDERKKVNSKQLTCQSEDTSCHKSKIPPNHALAVAPFSLEEATQDILTSECSSFVEHIIDSNSEALVSQYSPKFEGTTCATTDDLTILMKTDSKVCGLEETLDNISDLKVHTRSESESATTCNETKYLYTKGDGSPPLSERIREICNNLKSLCEPTPLSIKMPDEIATPCNNEVNYNDNQEPKTPAMDRTRYCTPQGIFDSCSSKLKNSIVLEYLTFFNSANKEELKSLKGIGEKRATYIMEMREESPEPFKSLDDLQDIGLSAKQIKGMMKQVVGGLF